MSVEQAIISENQKVASDPTVFTVNVIVFTTPVTLKVAVPVLVGDAIAVLEAVIVFPGDPEIARIVVPYVVTATVCGIPPVLAAATLITWLLSTSYKVKLAFATSFKKVRVIVCPIVGTNLTSAPV